VARAIAGSVRDGFMNYGRAQATRGKLQRRGTRSI